MIFFKKRAGAATSERVQQPRSGCSNPGAGAATGACAATSERVQQLRSVCSNLGACAATPERVQQPRSVCSNTERVQQVRSVCSKLGACAAELQLFGVRAEKSINSGYRTLGLVGGVARGGRADLIC